MLEPDWGAGFGFREHVLALVAFLVFPLFQK